MKGVFEEVLHIAYTEGKAKGGIATMKEEIYNAMENFINNPCLETAVSLIKVEASCFKYFEDSKYTAF